MVVPCSTYTKCGLTYHKDKLVAISGIARELKGCFRESKYLAGMWDHSLPFQFLWRVSGNSGGSVRPDVRRVYVAPTWSCASVAYPVQPTTSGISWELKSTQETRMVKFTDAEIHTLNGDEMGPVTGGFVRVIGILVPGAIDQNSKGTSDFFPWCQKSQGQEQDFSKEDKTWVQLDDLTLETTGTYYCAPFFPIFCYPLGLVLKHVDGCQGRFQRVGTFHIGKKDWFGDGRRREELLFMIRATKERKEIITENLYEAYDEETDRYNFTVV